MLETTAIEAGVTIRTGVKVAKILVENGRSQGVILQSGERVDANIVVSNADAKTTFHRFGGRAAVRCDVLSSG